MTIDELFISLGLKTDGVKKGAQEAESAISGMTSSIVAKLGVLSAGAAAALSIFSRFGEYVSQADAMGKLADALDVDIEKMHAWGEAAARAGGSVEGFQGSLQALTTQLARQATVGTSRAAKMLEGVGIDAGEIGRQRQAFDVMMDLAEKAETMGKQEFFGLGRSLGLDQGTIMLLQQGREALKAQIQAQKEFGVYTKEDAKVTADWNDRVADFGQVMKSFAAIIFRMILPAMTKFVEIVNKGIAFLRKHETFVKAFFIGLAAVITGILIPALTAMAAAWLANPMTLTIMAVVAALALLAAVIEDLVVWAEGGESALSDLWEAIFGSPEEAQKTWESIKEGFANLVEFITPLFIFLKDTILAGFKAMLQGWTAAVKGIIEVAGSLKNTFSDLAGTIQSTLGAAFNWVIEKWNAVAAVLGMTKINVEANVVANRADAEHGGGGGAVGDFINSGEPHAEGGIFNTPHVGLVAEDGAEAVIPMAPQKRTRAYDLLSSVAGAFGVKPQEKETTPVVNINNEAQPAPVVNVNNEEKPSAPIFDISNILSGLKIPAPIVNFEMPKISLPAMPKIEMPKISAAQALPMGGAVENRNNNITTDTRVNVGTVNINAEDGTDAANQFMSGIESRAAQWTAAANVAY